MMLKYFLTVYVAFATKAAPMFAGSIVIKGGSDTLGAKLVPQLVLKLFRAKHPETTFDIAAEGSTTGIAAITDGTAQIGMSSRKVELTEEAAAQAKGVKFVPTVVAYDGIAVVVNEKNPVAKLTRKQVEKLFTGDVTDWSAVGGKAGAVSIYTRNTSSGDFQATLQDRGDEETRIRGEFPEDGRQRADCRRSRQERERDRLLRNCLYELARRESRGHRWNRN